MYLKSLLIQLDAQGVKTTSLLAMGPDGLPVHLCGLIDGSLSRCNERLYSFGGGVFLIAVLIRVFSRKCLTESGRLTCCLLGR
jgi:hypothetical protein